MKMNKENEDLSEEELKYMEESFDKEFWPKMKFQLKEMTKKEACFVCFMTGYDLSRYAIEEEMKKATEKISKMSEEEIKEMLEKESGELWEDKTKINGIWRDDKTGKVLKDGDD
jgi:hypothetical protein